MANAIKTISIRAIGPSIGTIIGASILPITPLYGPVFLSIASAIEQKIKNTIITDIIIANIKYLLKIECFLIQLFSCKIISY